MLMSYADLIHAQEFGKILIQNVRLIDRDGQTEDQIVNILIKEKNLDIVTTDEIELEDDLIGYDGQNGIVLGVLNIGQPANFMVLDRDPRDDIEVLLDTRTHAVLAIRDGIIVKNRLTQVGAPEPEQKVKKKSGWIAYTPPPMALPITYQDKTKWNRWNTKYFSGIFFAAAALDRQRWLTQDDTSMQQVGDLKDYEGGEIRVFRLGIAGTFNLKIPIIYTFVIATHAFDKGYDRHESDDVTLLDYRLDIPLSKQLAISIGKQKEPISMERLLMGTQLQMQERPVAVDALFPARNVGIIVNGTGIGQRVAWAVGVFNDWFDASKSFDESSNYYIGRVSGLVWISEDESNLVHLGLGLRYTEAKEPLQYGTQPEFNQSPVFVETGPIDADNALTYDIEVSWRKGPYWIAGEFLRNEVNSAQWENPVFNGFHVSGSWILTGEMRNYDRRNGTFGPSPVSKSVYQGGIGTWELAARYSIVDLNAGLVEGGKVSIISLGLNWWLTPTFGINFNYRHLYLDQYGSRGRSSGIMGRVILVLE